MDKTMHNTTIAAILASACDKETSMDTIKSKRPRTARRCMLVCTACTPAVGASSIVSAT